MNGLEQTVYNANGTPSVSNAPILFYYRLEDYDKPNANEFNTANINTLWINANSTGNSMTSSNYCVLTLAAYIGGTLLGGKNSAINNSFSSGELTINASVPSFSIISSNKVYIYF